MKNSKNQKWYFEKGNGRMKTGLRPIDGRYYYFDPKTGAAKQGFIEFEVGMRYFLWWRNLCYGNRMAYFTRGREKIF